MKCADHIGIEVTWPDASGIDECPLCVAYDDLYEALGRSQTLEGRVRALRQILQRVASEDTEALAAIQGNWRLLLELQQDRLIGGG